MKLCYDLYFNLVGKSMPFSLLSNVYIRKFFFLYIIKCIFASYPLLSVTTVSLSVGIRDAHQLNVKRKEKII